MGYVIGALTTLVLYLAISWVEFRKARRQREWAKEDRLWNVALDTCTELGRESPLLFKEERIQNKREVLSCLDAATWTLPKEQAQCCLDLFVHILRADEDLESRKKIPQLQQELRNGVRKALGLDPIAFEPRT